LTTLNSISVISWWSVFYCKGNRSTKKKQRPDQSHW